MLVAQQGPLGDRVFDAITLLAGGWAIIATSYWIARYGRGVVLSKVALTFSLACLTVFGGFTLGVLWGSYHVRDCRPWLSDYEPEAADASEHATLQRVERQERWALACERANERRRFPYEIAVAAAVAVAMAIGVRRGSLEQRAGDTRGSPVVLG